MRYLIEPLTNEGKTKCGTTNKMVLRYANDRNAIRYAHKHLSAPHFPPGQYLLSAWPDGQVDRARVVTTLYKMA